MYTSAQNDKFLIPNNFEMEFTDTIGGFAFDSLNHNLGIVSDTTRSIIKYFKYVGDHFGIISSVWTQDPHFICDYPKEPLIKGKIYFLRICLALSHTKGNFSNTMGFVSDSGDRISLSIKGFVLPIE